MGDGVALVPLEKRRLSDMVVDQITDLISSGHFQIGAKLPSERELARSFEVSRPLIREGLRIIESLGLIEVRPGVGAIVTQNGPATANVAGYLWQHPSEVLAMLEVREIVISRSTALAADRMTDAELRELKEIYKAQIDALSDESVERLARLDREFHNCIYRASRSSILFETDQYTRSVLGNKETSILTYGIRRVRSLAEHEKIIEALEARDPMQAAAAAQAHIKYGTDEIRRLMQGRIDRQTLSINGSNGRGVEHG